MTDSAADIAPLAGLLRQLRDLKRVRDASSLRSLAERHFARAWARLAGGEDLEEVASSETAAAVAAVRLAGLDAATMWAHGLSDADAADVLGAAFDDNLPPERSGVAGPLDAGLHSRLRATLGPLPSGADEPTFVADLIRQPRAGATHPGLPRLVLEPAESHADHCFAVAVFGVLLASRFGADPSAVFLTGLAHHLFNATLPDAGYAGDELIGADRLATMMDAATERALGDLPDALAERVRQSLATTGQDQFETPEAQAFHAADVLDRVLEMEWHQTAARFRLADALGRDTDAGQLDICHPGFYQSFQQDVLRRAGVWDEHQAPTENDRHPARDDASQRGAESPPQERDADASGSYEAGGHGAVPAESPLAGGPGGEDGRVLDDGAEIAHLERRELGS